MRAITSNIEDAFDNLGDFETRVKEKLNISNINYQKVYDVVRSHDAYPEPNVCARLGVNLGTASVEKVTISVEAITERIIPFLHR